MSGKYLVIAALFVASLLGCSATPAGPEPVTGLRTVFIHVEGMTRIEGIT